MKHKTVDYKKHPPVINITKTTMDRLKDEPNSGDLVSLYMWYCYVAVWQETNTIWANVSYMAKLTKWSQNKIRRVRKQLLRLELIEDIQKRETSGTFTKRYVAVRYLPVVRISRSTVNREPMCLTINKEVLGINNYRENAAHSRSGRLDTLLSKDNSFAMKYGIKIQDKLKLRSKYSPVKSATWKKEILYILNKMNVSKDMFKEVMKWYITTGRKLGPPESPIIYKVKDLAEKWTQIEDAMFRYNKKHYPLDEEAQEDKYDEHGHMIDNFY